MQKLEISDQAMEQAAEEVVASLLDTIPELGESAHEFSDGFEKSMQLLITKEKRRNSFQKIGRRAAAVVLATLVGLGAWLAVDQDARAAVFQWMRTVYENSVIYRFFNTDSGEELPDYRPTWVPDGYTEIQSLHTGEEQVLIYQSSDDIFTLTYHWMDDSGIIVVDETSGESKAVSVNGNPGYYHPSADADSTNDLLWADETSGLIFILSTYLPEHDVLHIAESVELADMPK